MLTMCVFCSICQFPLPVNIWGGGFLSWSRGQSWKRKLPGYWPVRSKYSDLHQAFHLSVFKQSVAYILSESLLTDDDLWLSVMLDFFCSFHLLLIRSLVYCSFLTIKFKVMYVCTVEQNVLFQIPYGTRLLSRCVYATANQSDLYQVHVQVWHLTHATGWHLCCKALHFNCASKEDKRSWIYSVENNNLSSSIEDSNGQNLNG